MKVSAEIFITILNDVCFQAFIANTKADGPVFHELGLPLSPRSRRICSGGPAVCPLFLANHTVSHIAQDMVVRCKVRYLRIKQYLHRMRRLALDPGCAQCCFFAGSEASIFIFCRPRIFTQHKQSRVVFLWMCFITIVPGNPEIDFVLLFFWV